MTTKADLEMRVEPGLMPMIVDATRPKTQPRFLCGCRDCSFGREERALACLQMEVAEILSVVPPRLPRLRADITGDWSAEAGFAAEAISGRPRELVAAR